MATKTILDNQYFKFKSEVNKNRTENYNYIDMSKFDRENNISTFITIFDFNNSISVRKAIIVLAPENKKQYENQYMFSEIRNKDIRKLSSLSPELNLFAMSIKETLKANNTNDRLVDLFYVLEELINIYAPIQEKNTLVDKEIN